MYNPSKIYCVDHAIASSIAFKFSEDLGRTIENIVFIELKRRGLEVYYWKDKKGRECDFLIKKGRAITEAVQVSSNISTMDTRDREITGAIAAAEEFGLKEIKILTTEDLGSETVIRDKDTVYPNMAMALQFRINKKSAKLEKIELTRFVLQKIS